MSDESRSEPTAVEKPVRDDKGRFLTGVSGNPFGPNLGRPKGSGMMAAIERQLALEGLLRMAERGDPRAMELILKRVAPERLALETNGVPLLRVRSFTGLASELAHARSAHQRGRVPGERRARPAAVRSPARCARPGCAHPHREDRCVRAPLRVGLPFRWLAARS